MNLPRIAIITLIVACASACSREQPSALPGAEAPAAAVPASAPPPPAPVVNDAVRPVEAPPPPLDAQIPPLATTGVLKCDEFFEKYRQCLNTRVGGDERAALAAELQSSIRIIGGNSKRNMDSARLESMCTGLRKNAINTVSRYGCDAL